MLVILLHATLLPQGSWSDEYFTFGYYRLYGAAEFWRRLLHWAARPASEIVIWLYWLAVRDTGRPLVAPTLVVAWCIGFLPWLAAVQPWRQPGRLARCALAIGLPAGALLGNAVGDLFFWPFGALAYLPALGLTAGATLLVCGPGLTTWSRRLAVAVALSVAAGCVEVGAFLAVTAAPLLALAALRSAEPASRSQKRLAVALTFMPFVVALVILTTLALGRGMTGTHDMGHAGYTHHLLPSLRAAVPVFFNDLVRPSGGFLPRSPLAKLLMLLACYACLAAPWPAQPPRAPILALLGGLLGTCFLSIATAFFQFGGMCCTRHESYRQICVTLIILCLAALLPRRRLGWLPGWTGPVLLAVLLLPDLPGRIRDIDAEWRLAPARAAIRAENFAAARRPGPAPMPFVLSPAGPLLLGDVLAPGSYALHDKPDFFSLGPMLFFNKDHIIARRPDVDGGAAAMPKN